MFVKPIIAVLKLFETFFVIYGNRGSPLIWKLPSARKFPNRGCDPGVRSTSTGMKIWFEMFRAHKSPFFICWNLIRPVQCIARSSILLGLQKSNQGTVSTHSHLFRFTDTVLKPKKPGNSRFLVRMFSPSNRLNEVQKGVSQRDHNL